MQHIYNTTDVL